MWRKTNDKRGLEPVKPIICPFCGREMIYRFTSVTPLGMPPVKGFVCAIAFKCPYDDYVAKFDVAISEEYYQEYKKLNPSGFYHEPEKWLEDERIKERLKRLGYW